jgi:DNA topoisomerase-1
MFEAPSILPKQANEAAEAAGLRYVSDETSGITRLGKPGRFRYRDAQGKPVRDGRTLLRIRKLAIPPAWTGVWIAPGTNAHLQATGRDAKGRKQYRYHPDFIGHRSHRVSQYRWEFHAGV